VVEIVGGRVSDYARRSDLKDVAPGAVDISGPAAAKETATRAENERRIVEMERKRLRTAEAEKEGR
jgi:hypothetical protein